MADHPTLKDGAGGTFRPATDEVVIGGVTTQVPRVKLGFGADGFYLEVQDADGLRFPIGGAALGSPADAAWGGTGPAGLNAVMKGLYALMAAGIPLSGAVSLLNAEGVKGQFGGITANVSTTITRPGDTTPYSAGDLVSPATAVYPQLALARTAGGSFEATAMRLASDCPGLAGVSMRVRLWGNAAPTYPNGDNAAYNANASAGAGANYLGSYVGMFEQFSGKATAILAPEVRPALVKLAAGQTNVFWDLQTLDPFNPGAANYFAVTAEVRQD